jgi:1-acyl-sn-glycerol-3-phosphate acyltransferase
MMLAQWFVLASGRFNEFMLPRIWHRLFLKVADIRLVVHGRPHAGRPLLIACNHISWVDISVIGAVADVHFIAKREMADWPVIGWLARLQRSLFVDRQRRWGSGEQVAELSGRFGSGDALVLFAEGTTSDGNRLQPFKSTLFGAVEKALATDDGARFLVQPAAIAYTRLHGMPMGRLHRRHVAWIGDMDFLPHMVALLREGAVDVQLRFGEPLAFDATANRKVIAREMEVRIGALFRECLRNP